MFPSLAVHYDMNLFFEMCTWGAAEIFIILLNFSSYVHRGDTLSAFLDEKKVTEDELYGTCSLHCSCHVALLKWSALQGQWWRPERLINWSIVGHDKSFTDATNTLGQLATSCGNKILFTFLTSANQHVPLNALMRLPFKTQNYLRLGISLWRK